ncbi:MAG TPA: hypothetical protein VNA26_01820 [Chitinophagaceae bacterium]|nr:hypothetical protein [Chitinophagaceae bacterium]
MKKVLLLALISIALFSCGGASDGDATTDTTTMPVDTSVQNTISTDTAGYVNTPSGKVSLDSNVVSKKSTGSGSKPAKKKSEKTPKHDPNGRDTTRF